MKPHMSFVSRKSRGFITLFSITIAVLATCCGGSSLKPLLPVELGALAPRRDTYVILAGGQRRGSQVTSIERTPDGWRYIEELHLGANMEQRTELTMTATLEMRGVVQRGKMGDVPTAIDVHYAGGHATGTARTPGPDGHVKTLSIDAILPANVVDDNALQALLPALPMSEGATHSLDVFSSGSGKLHRATVTVKGRERLTVAAGTYNAWHVDITGEEVNVTMFVSVESPRRVLKVTSPRMPLEFQLSGG